MSNPNLIKGCCDVCVAVACFLLLHFFKSLYVHSSPWRVVGGSWFEFLYGSTPGCSSIIVVAYIPAADTSLLNTCTAGSSVVFLACFWIIWRVLELVIELGFLPADKQWFYFIFWGGALNSSLKTSLSFCLGIHLLSVTHTAFHCVKTASFWRSKWCRQPEWSWPSRSPAHRGWQLRARSSPEENKTTHH